jgi:CheY-like chemotaxis protein
MRMHAPQENKNKLPQKKILYVEDNQDTAEAVQAILTNVGYVVDITNCGKGALALAQSNYDLILLDVMLPDMSGWDIFEHLNPLHPRVKFAFLSAIPVTAERLAELKTAGVVDYILKPFTKADLVSRVQKIVPSTP